MSRPIRSCCLLCGLLLVSTALRAEAPPPQTEDEKKVYRKYHPDGVVEFTDQPSRGSEELQIEELPTYKFTPATPPAEITPSLKPRAKQQAEPEQDIARIYKKLTITRPSRGETIRSNSGDLDVSFDLSPALQYYRGDRLEYLLNGKSILKTEQPQTLKNLDRGTHTLVIRVIDKDNKVLIHSDSVTFHLKRYFKPKPSSQNPTPPDDNNFDAEYDT